jgi:hypothetical protein
MQLIRTYNKREQKGFCQILAFEVALHGMFLGCGIPKMANFILEENSFYSSYPIFFLEITQSYLASPGSAVKLCLLPHRAAWANA